MGAGSQERGRDGSWDADVTPEGVAEMRARSARAMAGDEWVSVLAGREDAKPSADGWGEV